MPRSVCRDCNRNVVMMDIGGELVAAESEVIEAVPVRRASGDGGFRRSGGPIEVRRLHAALCATYVEQNRKERIAREQRDFEAKQRRAQNRNHGL